MVHTLLSTSARATPLPLQVKEYLDLAKTKLGELEALQNENKANNKLEGLRRALANSVHQRQQVQVCATSQRRAARRGLCSARSALLVHA